MKLKDMKFSKGVKKIQRAYNKSILKEYKKICINCEQIYYENHIFTDSENVCNECYEQEQQ